MNISSKNWSGKSKVAARHDTVIYPYYSIFGQSIPKNEQYWTLAGNVGNNEGEINPECEALQVTNSKLVSPNQFFGVDVSEEVISKNKILLPKFNWMNGRLSQVARQTPKFNPAIINIDHHKMIEAASSDLFSMISILNKIEKPNILLVFNVLAKNPYNGYEDSEDSIVRFLCSNHHFQEFLTKFNPFNRGVYRYEGTGIGIKKFLSFIFYKKG
jgi:hypothetical protein